MPYDNALGRHPVFGKRNPSNRGMPLCRLPLRSLEQARADLTAVQRASLGRLGIDPIVIDAATKPCAPESGTA